MNVEKPNICGFLRWAAHNLIAHPMMVLIPRFGNWLHDGPFRLEEADAV